MDLSYQEEDSEQLRQIKESFRTGLRSVECPECGTVAKTEVDNDYIYCENCDERVKVGRLI